MTSRANTVPRAANAAYMREYRQTLHGRRQSRISTAATRLALEWLRREHPAVWADCRRQAALEIDEIDAARKGAH